MLQWPETCVPEARHLITRNHFSNPVNGELFETMLKQFDAGRFEKSRWVIPFTQFLRDSGRLKMLGDVAYLMQLATESIAESSVSFYAEMLRSKFVQREMITLSSKLRNATYGATDEDEVGEILISFSRQLDRIKDDALSGRNGSEQFTTQALRDFDTAHDPESLGGRRWLVRGITMLWAGGSGFGKSTLAMQFAIYWACGEKCFNLGPYRPLKSLILQAENDLGDMAEQFQGVCAGIADTHDLDLDEKKALIDKNIIIHRVVGKTGDAFLAELDHLIQQTRCDIVWIDPLFAFAGCDLMNSEKTGRFLRNGLFPIAWKRNVILQVLHHVGKPVRAENQNVASMSDIEYQYLAIGTSEIQNSFRAVNVMMPTPKPGVYKLVLSKRGDRAGAKDHEGKWTTTLFIQQAKEGKLCWALAKEPAEQEQKPRGRQAKYNDTHVLKYMHDDKPMKAGKLQRLCREDGMSERTFWRLWEKLDDEGSIKEIETGWVPTVKTVTSDQPF